LVNDYEHIPCGSPVVLDKDYFNNPDVREMRAFSLFTSRAGMDPNSDFTLPKDYFELVSLKPLVRTHRTVSIEQYNPDKAVHIGEYVKHLGGITFVVEDEIARIKLANDLFYLTKVYKYNSLLYHNKFGRKYLRGEDDCVLGIVSFFSLPYCVPIFNTKKVDGMGVSYCEAIMKESIDQNRLIRTYRMDFVLSNFEENLFVIDGATVNPINPVQSATFNELGKWAAQKLEVRTKDPYNKYHDLLKTEDANSFEFSSDQLTINSPPDDLQYTSKDEGHIIINGENHNELYTTGNVEWTYNGSTSGSSSSTNG
jgi:hypothetical protein